MNYTTLKIGFTFCLSFHLIIWSLWHYNLFKYIISLKNKGERSLVIPQYFTGCFISKRVDKRNLLYLKMLEVIIFNQKEDMAEKLLLIQLVLFNSDSVLCVLQLIILYFCLKKYIQSTYGTVLVRYGTCVPIVFVLRMTGIIKIRVRKIKKTQRLFYGNFKSKNQLVKNKK